MNNINDRFWNELFVEKKVNYNQEQYDVLYDKIWKNEKLFKDFLTSKSESIQRQSSIDIVELFSFSMECSLPSFYFRTLVSSEQIVQENSAHNKKREHSVHCVMIYILGIWLFFNHQLFNKYILEQMSKKVSISNEFEKPISVAINGFIDSWILFSFFHDIGYVFEDNIDAQGICSNEIYTKYITRYKQIDESVYYEIIIKYMSNLILIMNIFLKSKNSFKEKNKNLFKNLDFIDFKTQKKINLFHELEDFNINLYYYLYNITCYDEIIQLYPYITSEKIITVVKDKDLQVVYVKKGKDKVYMVNKMYELFDSSLNDFDALGYESYNNSCFLFEYYVETPNNVLNEYFMNTNYSSFFTDNFILPAEQIGTKFSSDFLELNCFNNFERLKYKIYLFLKKSMPIHEFFAPNEAYEHKGNDVYKETLINYMKAVLSDYKYDGNDNYAKKLWEYAEGIFSDNNMLRKYIIDIMRESKSNNEISTLKHFTKMIYDNFKKFKNNDVLIVKDSAVGQNIEYDLFDVLRKEGYDEKTKEIYDAIGENILDEWSKICTSKDINDFKKLLTYHYKSKYDHGIVSSSILFQIYLLNQTINSSFVMHDKSTSQNLLAHLSLNNITLIKQIDVFSNAIIAILFHNIFSTTYKTMFNESFIQSLESNAFSYFAAFCDNLQTWDRPEVLDFYNNDISSRYIAGSNMGIEINNNRIIITFKNDDIRNKLYKYKDSLNDFLENASALIELVFVEH